MPLLHFSWQNSFTKRDTLRQKPMSTCAESVSGERRLQPRSPKGEQALAADLRLPKFSPGATTFSGHFP
ncbi:MAG: hypothetical protein CL813_11085 [Confluentimicrobium sp.]|nr:hypothetical protein [Actibacterium sp.]MBF53471.1 hypothetical protein [Actibacterium sp.]